MSTKVTSVDPNNSIPPCIKIHKEATYKTEKPHKNAPKKVLTSKKPASVCTESKSSSLVSAKKFVEKPKKTTKSDCTVTKIGHNTTGARRLPTDHCNRCCDGKGDSETQNKIGSILSAVNSKCVRNDNSVKKITKNTSKPVQQYYKNENFYVYEESLHDSNDAKKASLDTITEVSDEMQAISEDSIFRIFTDSDDNVTFFDPNSEENIKKLKEFREKNYFECHSAKSRIKTRVSATSLNDHKCVYRFYLNERLFPVPLNTDYNNKVRCVECQLPMDIKKESSGDKINGTIQAKVKLGSGDAQDMLLLLPVKDDLIIEERKKDTKKADDSYVYFGVVKLSANGNSIFNKTLPHNSFALKYQKGYQEYQDECRYNYKEIKEDDVIII